MIARFNNKFLRFVHDKNLKKLKKELDRFESIQLERVARSSFAHKLLQEGFDVKDTSREVERRLIALEYREKLSACQAMDANDPLLIRFFQLSEKWKNNHPLLLEKSLTSNEKERLFKACSYPKFIDLFINCRPLQEQFFKWTIRDGLDPEVFIEFPHLYEKIVHAHLNGRLGRIGGHLLQLHENEKGKIVTLPFEGKEVNILNEDLTVSFNGGYSLTIRDVFHIFEMKDKEVGNLELMAGGVTNWNTHQLGSWNAIDKRYEKVAIDQRGWWKQLPPFEILTLQKAKARYGEHMDGVDWNVAATASRGSATLDFDKSHAYLELAIPQGNGLYSIFSFGKFATKFPKNIYDKLTFLCQNLHATVAFPDENVYYTHRQHAQKNFALTPEQGFKMMEIIASDIALARAGNFVYQIESDNCAKWSHEVIAGAIGDRNVPNLFQMPLLDTEPLGFAKYIFSTIKKLPTSWQVLALNAIHFPLGAWKKTRIIENGSVVDKSLCSHSFWKTGVVYLPAHLHHFISHQSEWKPAYVDKRNREENSQGASPAIAE